MTEADRRGPRRAALELLCVIAAGIVATWLVFGTSFFGDELRRLLPGAEGRAASPGEQAVTIPRRPARGSP